MAETNNKELVDSAEQASGESSEIDVSSNLPTIRKASQFDIKYPYNSKLTPKENDKIRNAINKEGIVDENKTFISEKGVKDLLKTDKKGVAIVINNAPSDEVKTYDDKDYLSTPEIQKEIAKRKEQSRPQLEREYLATSSKALDAFSRNQELEKERTIQSDRNVQDRSKIRSKVLKKRKPKVSEVTGADLDDTEDGKPVVHHINRVSDNPEKFSDDKNLTVMRKDEHEEFHSDSKLLPNSEGLDEYKRRKMNSKDKRSSVSENVIQKETNNNANKET